MEVTPKDRVEPGENVEILIQADPNAIVGLSGVDKSTLILADGNDITVQKVCSLCCYLKLSLVEFYLFLKDIFAYHIEPKMVLCQAVEHRHSQNKITYIIHVHDINIMITGTNTLIGNSLFYKYVIYVICHV